MYTNLNNPVNYQLQDFGQFGFRVLDSTSMVVDGETYRTLYVVDDAVVSATTSKGDDLVSKPLLAGTLLHGLFSAPTVASGKVLAYMAGRLTAEEILELYTAYLAAIAGTTLENTDCLYDDLNQMGADTYADASLVLIPSGYSTGVVYGQRPLDSDSQITFTRASDATRVNASGLIETVASGVPRIDYTGGGCGKLLLEPQRTNLVTFSEQFDNAVWTKSNATITANQVVSPDGYTNAEFIVPANGVDGVITQGAFSFTSGTSYTLSVYGKKEDFNFLLLAFPSAAFPTNNRVGLFDLNAGTVASATQSGTGAVITNVGNGWYRCSISIAANATNSGNIVIAARSSNNLTSLGNGTDGIYIWGAQLEAGAYPTSYIPTLAFSVTRVADQAFLSNSTVLPTAYPFTLFADFDVTTATEGQAITFSNSALSNEYFSIDHNAGFYRALSRPSSTISSVTSTVPATVGFHKICGVFTSTTIKLFVDGVLVASGANAQAFNSSINDIFVGQLRSVIDTGFRNSVKKALVLKSELSDAQAITLTTL